MNGFLDTLMGNDLAGSASGGPEVALQLLPSSIWAGSLHLPPTQKK